MNWEPNAPLRDAIEPKAGPPDALRLLGRDDGNVAASQRHLEGDVASMASRSGSVLESRPPRRPCACAAVALLIALALLLGGAWGSAVDPVDGTTTVEVVA